MAQAKKPRNSQKNRGGQHPHIAWQRPGIRIAHHRHSGRFIPWRYTSYVVLYFIVTLAAFLVLFAANAVRADQQAQGQISLSGTVLGDPPANPATIVQPKDGQHFTDRPITVAGDCDENLFVDVYRDDVYAGTDLCNSQGYELSITLLPGTNHIKVRIKNSAGQYGPDSQLVTIFYDVPVSSPERPTANPNGPTAGAGDNIPAPFLLHLENSIYNSKADKKFQLIQSVNGGSGPYAVSVDWGDGTNPAVNSYKQSGSYGVEHIYRFAGQFTIRLTASDSDGISATIQTIVIIQDENIGQPTFNGTGSNNCDVSDCFLPSQSIINLINHYLWPAVLVAAIMTFSFWLGERVVYAELNRDNRFGKLRRTKRA